MTKYLIEFLKALEVAVPPPPYCHHALMYAPDGQEDRLQINVNDACIFRSLWAEDEDLQKPVGVLAGECAALIQRMRVAC